MPGNDFENMKAQLGFATEDIANIAALREPAQRLLPQVLDAFLDRIAAHADVRALMTDDPRRAGRMRESVRAWLGSLFDGHYDDDYRQARLTFGRTHVRIGLPQYYILVAMHTVRERLDEGLRSAGIPEVEPKLRSLHKLLAIETGLLLETYKEAYADQVREFERESVRDRLHQAEHLAHIGHLAANLAHEIKNPLAGISGAIQVMQQALPAGHAHHPVLREILRQIDRLDGTVKDLLVYARPKPPRFQRCNLSRLIERVLAVLQGEPEVQRADIEFIDSKRLDLFADEGQIEQLLINLILNAAQATGEGGAVRVYTTSTADGLRLVVEDQGQGMTAETIAEAFEPFFTTKSRGTGLGLPICRKIVEAHGGTITIDSEPGQGTAVSVRLPRFPPASSGGEVPDEDPRIHR